MTENLLLENVSIIYRNFSGREIPPYNRFGDRNFSVIFYNADLAQELISKGWNVKYKEATDDYPEQYTLKVKIRYPKAEEGTRFMPNIYMITENSKTLLNENTIGELDFADIKNVDIMIRPYNWENNGKSGITAYAKSMYVTIDEDLLRKKYAEYEHPEDDALPLN